jgi:hypothetical protein
MAWCRAKAKKANQPGSAGASAGVLASPDE